MTVLAMATMSFPAHRPDDRPTVAGALDHSDWVMLNHLRMAARRCRAARRIDLFHSCADLGRAPEGGAATVSGAGRFTDTLLRALDAGLNDRAVFYKPGCTEVSFDERWLVSLLAALRRDDTASAAFLLHSRLDRTTRRPIGFLASGVAKRGVAA